MLVFLYKLKSFYLIIIVEELKEMVQNKLFMNEQLEKRMYSVGIDLTLIESLINFLDISMNDEIDVSKVDIANLTVVIKRLVKIVKAKYDRIERILNI